MGSAAKECSFDELDEHTLNMIDARIRSHLHIMDSNLRFYRVKEAYYFFGEGQEVLQSEEKLQRAIFVAYSHMDLDISEFTYKYYELQGDFSEYNLVSFSIYRFLG